MALRCIASSSCYFRRTISSPTGARTAQDDHIGNDRRTGEARAGSVKRLVRRSKAPTGRERIAQGKPRRRRGAALGTTRPSLSEPCRGGTRATSGNHPHLGNGPRRLTMAELWHPFRVHAFSTESHPGRRPVGSLGALPWAIISRPFRAWVPSCHEGMQRGIRRRTQRSATGASRR